MSRLDPHDLDFSQLDGDRLRSWRLSTPPAPTHNGRADHLTQEGAAHRLGVSVRQYRRWERGGTHRAWAALLRLHQDDGLDVSPVEATGRDLRRLICDVGSLQDVAKVWPVRAGTLYRWMRQRRVPAAEGWGRVVRVAVTGS